jgi:hypothetical protein
MSNPAIVALTAILSGCSLPTLLVYMRQRHRERMKLLENQAQARSERVALLEAANLDLEARIRTLETIATSGDRDLEARLRQLNPASAVPRLRSPQG